MQSYDTTPRFRNLSINSTPRFFTSSFSINEKDSEEHRDPEKECFMCRQANVYINPIGMQQERRVARRHPPPLTRAQIDELSQKKQLTKREARMLLQCYFPEIKNVKYFQLHKYHSCCYDPKHLNLCKNHITAFQHQHDQAHFKTNNGQHSRVSFVRIKIEPTQGIPTRFLGPAALPESLADMLIKQVNKYENKKRPSSFYSEPQSELDMYKVQRLQQQQQQQQQQTQQPSQLPYGNSTSRLSEHLANMVSDDDEDEDDDDNDDDNYNNSDEDENDNDVYEANETLFNAPTSNIRGFQGKVMDRSRTKYERKLLTREEKRQTRERSKLEIKEDASTNVTNGDLVVEDVDEIQNLFVNEHETKPNKPLKKKKRKKRNKKHLKPKLNHWEQMALEQSKQEACGCRHHVRRLEADQVLYEWCRCKDHLHKNIRQRRKSVPSVQPPPSSPTKIKIKKKVDGTNDTEKTTTELALAYDPSAVTYNVIQETLYFRTTSGRLVKPEITSSFSYNDKSIINGPNPNQSYLKKPGVVPIIEEDEKPQHKNTPVSSKRGSIANSHTTTNTAFTTVKNKVDEIIPLYQVHDQLLTTTGRGIMDGEIDNDDEDEEDNKSDTIDFIPPKYVEEFPPPSPALSSTAPMSMQKSSKPTFANQKPTPNFERETTILANRRWFDQALGDQNLLPVHDGRYGLIAGTSADQYEFETQLPDNEYVEPLPQKNKSNCTIS